MKYLILTLTLLVVFLGVVCRFLFSEINDLREDNATLRLNNDSLIANVKDYNNGKMEASETIVKIQEKIKYVKVDCDCYNTPIPDDILPLIRGE